MIRVAGALVGLLLAAGPLRAEPAVASPDAEIARRHYEAGVAAYDAGRYEDAIAAFTHARGVWPRPELDYNLGRCFDRLERIDDAIQAYTRYLAASSGEGTEAAARVQVLRVRQAQARQRHRRWIAPGVVAGGAVLVGAIAAGLVGSVAPRYDALSGTPCKASCAGALAEIDGLEARARAGYGLFALAGALVITDAVLFGLAARRGARGRVAW